MLSNRQLFLNHLAPTSSTPLALEISHAEGVYLFDNAGKRYMDLISGISVSAVGHRHPKVIAAIQDQLGKYMHLMVYGEYIQSPQVQLAKALTEILPSSLNSVYLVNSGSEAIEGAMKLAKRITGRTELVSFRNAYHGSTQGSLSIMGNEEFKQAFRPLLPDVRILEYNRMAEICSITPTTAAVFMETVQGEAGAVVPDLAFIQAVRKRCTEVGALLVLDEIQTGFGRTGKMFAFEHMDVVPDILCLAKGMGGGMPIGAFISSADNMACLTHDPILGHITTFGGHPVSCAAALACINLLQEQNWIREVEEKEQLFRQLLKHPKIKSIHGKGLLLAVEFESYEENKRVIDLAIEKGLITDWFLFNSHSLRIAPPLTISMEEIKWACNTLLSCL